VWLAASPTEAGIESAAGPKNVGWNLPSVHRTGQGGMPGIDEPEDKRACPPHRRLRAEDHPMASGHNVDEMRP